MSIGAQSRFGSGIVAWFSRVWRRDPDQVLFFISGAFFLHGIDIVLKVFSWVRNCQGYRVKPFSATNKYSLLYFFEFDKTTCWKSGPLGHFAFHSKVLQPEVRSAPCHLNINPPSMEQGSIDLGRAVMNTIRTDSAKPHQSHVSS